MESLFPFLQGFFLPDNMPVYPGARRIIAKYQIARDPAGNVLWPGVGVYSNRTGWP